jgi:hypothetical protein
MQSDSNFHSYGQIKIKISLDHYKNVTLDSAKMELMVKEVGDYIFRPSTKGVEHLSLTMKFPGACYGLYDIVERKK